MKRTITILGMGPTAYERRVGMASHVEGEVWSLNNAYDFYKDSGITFDRFFELHKWDYLKTWNPGHDKDHFRCLSELGCDVWVTEPLPSIHNQKIYPHIDLFRHFKTNYFLGSPSLMLALAIYEHDMGKEVDQIKVFGVDTSDPSHSQQRQSWTFWLSKAMDRGIVISGTGADCFAEHEKDAGLRGLREEIGDVINNLNSEIQTPPQGE